jgi:hypothetical protein
MPKPANALYDAQHGWNPPNRFQQERAWCEVVQKEKHIQGKHEEQSRARPSSRTAISGAASS